MCDGKYIVFLNPDIQLTPGWLETMVAWSQKYPEAGVIEATIVHYNGIIDHAGYKDGIVFGRGENLADWKSHSGGSSELPVDMIHGCCFLVKREIIPVVGKFDERFFLYCEENDNCIRVRKTGFTIVCSPAVVYHYGSGAGIPRHKRTEYLRQSMEIFNAKWKMPL